MKLIPIQLSEEDERAWRSIMETHEETRRFYNSAGTEITVTIEMQERLPQADSPIIVEGPC